MRTLPRLTLFLLLLSMIFFGGERTSCASPPDVYDLFHQDQTSTTLNNIGLNTPQTHALYVAQDEDWAVFHAQAGLPYSIKITAVAPGIDPALEVFIANPNASGETRDFAAEGGDETYSRVNWPQTGPVWVRVHGTGSFSGATSYTLTVTGDWGANLGLATISGFASTFAYAQGGRLQLPETLPQADSSPVPALYSRTALSFSPNTFDAPAPPILLLSGYGDPIHRLDQPWIVAWNALYRGNCAISRVGLSPNMATAQPMELGIEMRTESIQANLSDGAITWLDLTLVDVPTGSSPGFVRIYQWSFGAGQWLPYDEHPQVTPIPDGWLAKTFVHAPVNNAWLSDFYAAAIVPRGASATTWMLYE